MTLAIENAEIKFLGKIPENWRIVRVRRITQEHKQGYYPEQEYINEGVKLVRITDIDDSATVFFQNMPFITISAKDEQAFKVQNGDFIFARSGTIGRFGLVKNSERSVFASYLIRFRFKDVNLEFLRFVFSSQFFKEGLISTLHGGANQNVHAENIKEQFIAIPLPDKQGAIATFLDRKTAAITTLIAKKERLIQLLEEKRTALINQAVTKGLNPNVPMKDSGIPWIGKIPEHWQVKRFKFMINYLEQGWSPSCENRLVDEQEWGVLKVGCVNGGYFNELEHKALPIDLTPKLEYKIKTGDILISRANTKELLGSTARVHAIERKLLLCDKLYRLKTVNDVNPAFFVILMKSNCARYQFERDSSGASNSMQNISQDSIKDFVLPLAPHQEQQLIINTVNKNFHILNNLKEKLLNQIEKLQEYRQSLITAAVTGKIDISEEVAA